MVETAMEFLKWWYTDFLLDDMAWTNILNLFNKTVLIGIVLMFPLGIVLQILVYIVNFLNWLNHRGWEQKESK